MSEAGETGLPLLDGAHGGEPGGGRHGADSSVGSSSAVWRGALMIGMAMPLVLAGVALVAHLVLGFSAVTVLSGSMRPGYQPGDVMLTRLQRVSQLRVGDIAVLRPPGQDAPTAHRIIEITGSPQRPVLHTKGDANPAADSWRGSPTGDRVPVAVGKLPWVGELVMHLRAPIYRAVLVTLLGLCATAGLIRQFTASRCTSKCHQDRATP